MVTNNLIIETYLKLGTEHGFDNVSLSMIAGQTGITKATLFSHFESFDAIKEAAVQFCQKALEKTDNGINYRSKTKEELAYSLTDSLIQTFTQFPLNAYLSLLTQKKTYSPDTLNLSRQLDMMITARLTVALDFTVQHTWADISDTDFLARILTPAFRELLSSGFDASLYEDCVNSLIKIRN